jgi:hypothetical protein
LDGLAWPTDGLRRSFELMGTTRQQILLETLAARQRAAELLKTLEQAQQECDGCLKSDQRQDLMKTVTGKSSIETAMATAKRMVEMLDRAMEEASKPVTGEQAGDVAPAVVGRIGMGGMGMAGRVAGNLR